MLGSVQKSAKKRAKGPLLVLRKMRAWFLKQKRPFHPKEMLGKGQKGAKKRAKGPLLVLRKMRAS